MKNRKLVVGLLVMLAVVMSTLTFAYWASSVSGSNSTVASNSITIGQGEPVTTSVSFAAQNAEDALVPTAYIENTGDDTSVLTFSVEWNEDTDLDADDTAGTVVATISNYSLGSLTQAQILNMFTFTVDSATAITLDGDAVSYSVSVVFANEPATKAIYDEVASGTLSFDVTFTVTVS